jgi:hypothetical protein
MHGQIGDVQVGKLYTNREEFRLAGVHRAPVAGIAGYGGAQPAESVVVAGGYEDDTDYDDLIIYTGEGGNDPGSRYTPECNSLYNSSVNPSLTTADTLTTGDKQKRPDRSRGAILSMLWFPNSSMSRPLQ